METNIDGFCLFIGEYGVSFPEYAILTSIDDAPIDQKKLAQYTMRGMRHDPRGKTFSLADYTEAIKSCLGKGWIKILTKEDCEYTVKYWRSIDSVYLPEYREGFVDFSMDGANLFYRIIDRLNKRAGIGGYFENIILHVMKHKNTLNIFTETEININNALENLQTNPGKIFRHGEKIVAVGEPYQISNWWVNRFKQLPAGWRVDIKYEECNERM